MRVLGLDPGLATTGYAVVEASGRSRSSYRLLEAGVITTPSGCDTPERLGSLHEELGALIEEYRPDVLAIEEIFFSKNAKTAIAVAQARGVLLLAACQHALEIHGYTPLQVKRRITGSGKARKVQMQAMVQRLLGLAQPPRPDDAADAVALALCYLMERRTAWMRMQAQAQAQARQATATGPSHSKP